MVNTRDMTIDTGINDFAEITPAFMYGIQGPVGPMGPQGPQGEKGDKGDPGGDVFTVNGQKGDVVLDSSNINYNEHMTIKEALDDLLYVAPVITSFTGGGTYEVGSTISKVNLNWVINKNIISQSLNNDIGELEPSSRTYTVNKNITTNTTYTLTVNDGKQTANKSTSINFLYKRYWGVSESDSINNEQILAFDSEFASNRQQNRVFDCSDGKYFYFIIPTQFCNGISFKVGGLAFSGMNVETIQFTNASGHQSNYNVYRVNNIQTGSSINVEVL